MVCARGGGSEAAAAWNCWVQVDRALVTSMIRPLRPGNEDIGIGVLIMRWE